MDHTRMAATAERMILANGRAMVIKKLSRDPADPTKPHRGPGATFTASVDIVAMETDFDEDETTSVGRGDMRLLVAAQSAAQDLRFFDKLFDGGKVYGVVRCKRIQPGAVNILYDIHVRA